jgi:hypothetical protein
MRRPVKSLIAPTIAPEFQDAPTGVDPVVGSHLFGCCAFTGDKGSSREEKNRKVLARSNHGKNAMLSADDQNRAALPCQANGGRTATTRLERGSI